MKKFNSIELGIPADMTYKGRTIKSLTDITGALKSRDKKKAVKLIPDNDNRIEVKDAGTVKDGKLEFGTAEVEVPEAVVKRGRKVATLTPKTKSITSRKGLKSIRLRGTKENKVSILSKGQEVAVVERILKKLEEAPIPKKDISALKAKFQMVFKRHGFKKAVEQMRDVAKKYAEKGDDKKTEEYLKKLWRSVYGSLFDEDQRFKDWDFFERYKKIYKYLKDNNLEYNREELAHKVNYFFRDTEWDMRDWEKVLKRFKRGQTGQEFKKHVNERVDEVNKTINRILDGFDKEAILEKNMTNFKEYQELKPHFLEEMRKYESKYDNLKKAVNSGKIGNVLRAINFYLDRDIYTKANIDRAVRNMKLWNEGKGKGRAKITTAQIDKQMTDAFDNIFMDEFKDELKAYYEEGQELLEQRLRGSETKEGIKNFLNNYSLTRRAKEKGEEFEEELRQTSDITTILVPRNLL